MVHLSPNDEYLPWRVWLGSPGGTAAVAVTTMKMGLWIPRVPVESESPAPIRCVGQDDPNGNSQPIGEISARGVYGEDKIKSLQPSRGVAEVS